MGIEGLLVGRVLGDRYRIEEVIGRGGMGAVYRATDERLGRKVALKVVTASSAADAEMRERMRARFFREARSAAAIPHHPNVVPVYDYGSDEALGLDYLVMELLRGSDLASRLATGGIPPLTLSLRILLEAARGLSVGHRLGMIHRDVKPGNIFLARDANDEIQVRVVDFGIAKLADEDTLAQLTQDGRAPHSPAYASPEQLRGLTNLTPAADVFGLGAVAYQLLTGERPFDESDRNRMSLGMAVSPPSVRSRNPAIPSTVEAVILRALEYDPEKRYPNAGAMAQDLEEAIRALREGPLEPYLGGVGMTSGAAGTEDDRALLEDLDEGEKTLAARPPSDEDRTLVTGLDEDDRTLAAPPPADDDRTLIAPESYPPLPPRQAEPPPAGAGSAPPVLPPTPKRQALPPRRPPETRRGVGGMIVWGFVLLVLLAAGLWGWSELQRAPRLTLDGADTLDVEEPADTVGIPPEVLRAYELHLQGVEHENAMRYEDAAYYFRQAADLAQHVYEYRRNYALTLMRLGRYETAEPELRRALALDPSEGLLYGHLGTISISLRGDTATAIQRFKEWEAREEDPARRATARRYIETWEAALNPAVDLIGEPIDQPLPGEGLIEGDTVIAPPRPGPP